MIRVLIGLAALILAGAAHADELRPGYLDFSETTSGRWTLVWKAPMRGGLTPQTRPILPQGCTAEAPPLRQLSEGALTSRYRVACRQAVAGGRIGLAALDGAVTDVFVRVAPLGRPVQALRLTALAPVVTIAAVPDRWSVARSYFLTGVDHILEGYDHLLFVIALVLLIGPGWRVAGAVTAFTLAHSITLAGATLGLVGLPQRQVEAAIALSILFLAVEIVKTRPGEARLSARKPWLVAFAFGLLHGFGFAGALREIGLPEGEVPTALLAFNLGVEAGQLAVVLAMAALIAALRRVAAAAERPAMRAMAYATGGLAAFWLFDRTLG